VPDSSEETNKTYPDFEPANGGTGRCSLFREQKYAILRKLWLFY
jgi:hypothetical protein